MPSVKNTEAEAAEYRVVGPPGCGKTTWLGDQVQQAVESGMSVLISSLTKAAATEIGGRNPTGPTCQNPTCWAIWSSITPSTWVTLAGRQVGRTATGYQLLFELSENAGRVLTHDQLQCRVWVLGGRVTSVRCNRT